jgi:uncharacterized protein (TIGR03663 family)
MTTDSDIGAEQPEVERDQQTEAGVTAGIRETGWIIGAGGVFLVAAALRLWDLPLAPFHNDEGVSGWFVIQLLRHGTWTYDPGVYFGPTPYYAGLLSAILLGLNDTAMRIVPASFGLATIALVLALRRYIGQVGSLVAAGLLAASTGWLYYSRAFFAEELLIFFTVALVYCAWRWSETRRTEFLVFGAVSAALLFATKGTSYIAVAVLLLSAVGVMLYERLRIPERLRISGRPAAPSVRQGPTGGLRRAKPMAKMGSKAPGRRRQKPAPILDERPFASLGRGELVISFPVMGAVVLFGVIYITLFSSLFSNPKGVFDSFTTLVAWSGTAGSSHAKPITQYAEWLVRAEAPIFVLFTLGALVAVLGGRSRFALFASLWAAGLFAAYSLIAYKEPWLMLNFVVPMTIVGGYGVDRLWQLWPGRRVILIGAVGALLVFSSYGAIRLSFFDYDIDSNPYVYVQTSRDIFNLTSAVAMAGTELGTGAETPIVIMSPDYWPLPWYWRDNPNTGFYGEVVETTDPIAIVKTDQEPTLPATFMSAYMRQGEYTLRPGVQLALYVRRATSGL